MPDAAPRIRAAGAPDLPAIVALAGRALGWPASDPNEAFFRWKHLENPAGPSPMWVAEEGTELLGVRVFLRWRFLLDGEVLQAVRAVDTATDPAAQGRGIFRALTEHAVAALTAEGTDLVFNTPNAQSRPGYLKMGWQDLGRFPVATRPSGLRGVWALRGARTAAEKWSSPVSMGTQVTDTPDDVLASLCSASAAPGLSTLCDAAHLRWRYGFGPLHYRVVTLGTDATEGVAVVRLRRRGTARELAVCEIVTPDATARRRLLRDVLRASGADHAVLARWQASGAAVPAPGSGPLLTWRPLRRQAMPGVSSWRLSLGDLELL